MQLCSTSSLPGSDAAGSTNKGAAIGCYKVAAELPPLALCWQGLHGCEGLEPQCIYRVAALRLMGDIMDLTEFNSGLNSEIREGRI